MYQEQLRKLILKGLLGFAIGFIFALCRSPELGIRFSLIIGCFAIGVPYGWQLSGKVVGGGIIFGNFVIMILAFVLRAIVAILTGWIAYPIALVYTIIKYQQEK